MSQIAQFLTTPKYSENTVCSDVKVIGNDFIFTMKPIDREDYYFKCFIEYEYKNG